MLRSKGGIETARGAAVGVCDPSGHHYGQGLILHLDGEGAVVLTCHHVIAPLAEGDLYVRLRGMDGQLEEPLPAIYDEKLSKPEMDAVVLRVRCRQSDEIPLLYALDARMFAGSREAFGIFCLSPYVFTGRILASTRLDLEIPVLGHWKWHSPSPPSTYRIPSVFPLADATEARKGISGAVIYCEGGIVGLAHFARAESPAAAREVYVVPLQTWAHNWPALSAILESSERYLQVVTSHREAPAERQILRLSPEEKGKLINRLLACPSINDGGARDEVLSQLPSRLRNSVIKAKETESHVQYILDACLREPLGLESLIDAVRFFDADTPPMEALDNTLQQMLHQPVSLSEVAALKTILSRVEFAGDLTALYLSSASTDVGLPQRYDDRGQVACMLDWLAKMGKFEGGGHPIINFARGLLSYTKQPSVHKRIQDWIVSTANRLGVPTNNLGLLRDAEGAASAAAAAASLYLLIDLEPSVDDNRSFIVQAWLIGDRLEKKVYAGDEPVELEQLSKLMRELLELITDELIGARNELTIEIFLPNHLLCYGVDEWTIEEDETIGFHYRVSIRPRERARNKRYWPMWRQRWESINLSKVVTEETIAWWNDNSNPEWRALRVKLEGGGTCLALSSPPPPAHDRFYCEFLKAILRAGTPIAIWPRLLEGEGNVESELKAILLGGVLSGLPDTIRQRRRELWADDRGPSYNLTLLWDDPTRLPPELYLQAPQQ